MSSSFMTQIETTLKISLTKSQYSVSTESDQSPILLLSNAGSGKTTCLIARLIYLVLCKKVEARKILFLTFTKKASDEFKERIEGLEVRKRVLSRAVRCCTIHSFCYKLVMKYKAAFKFKKDVVRLIDGAFQKKIVADVLKKNQKLRNNTTVADVIKYINFCKSKDLNGNKLKDSVLRRCYELYTQILLVNSWIDFSDLINFSDDLLENKHVRNECNSQYSHVLVDEFQDISISQLRVIVALVTNGQITAAGSRPQQIYSFRGAEKRIFERFREVWKNAKLKYLQDNMRSTQRIINVCSSFIREKRVKSIKGIGEKVKIVNAPSEECERSFIASSILYLTRGLENKRLDEMIGQHCKRKFSYMDIVVVSRMRKHLFEMESTLRNFGIPLSTVSTSTLFSKPIIKDVMTVFHFLHNVEDNASFLKLLSKLTSGIRSDKANSYLKCFNRSYYYALVQVQGEGFPCTKYEYNQNKQPSILNFSLPQKELSEGDFRNLMPSTKMLTQQEQTEMTKFLLFLLDIKNMFEKFQSKDRPLEKFIVYLCGGKTIFSLYLSKYSLAKSSIRSLDDLDDANARIFRIFLSEVKSFEDEISSYEKKNFLQFFVDHCIFLDKEKEIHVSSTDSKVSLSTIHGIKGKEAKVVFLLRCNAGIIPCSRKETLADVVVEDDERNVFYVGISRAQDLLFISYVKDKKYRTSPYIYQFQGHSDCAFFTFRGKKEQFSFQNRKKRNLTRFEYEMENVFVPTQIVNRKRSQPAKLINKKKRRRGKEEKFEKNREMSSFQAKKKRKISIEEKTDERRSLPVKDDEETEEELDEETEPKEVQFEKICRSGIVVLNILRNLSLDVSKLKFLVASKCPECGKSISKEFIETEMAKIREINSSRIRCCHCKYGFIPDFHVRLDFLLKNEKSFFSTEFSFLSRNELKFRLSNLANKNKLKEESLFRERPKIFFNIYRLGFYSVRNCVKALFGKVKLVLKKQ